MPRQASQPGKEPLDLGQQLEALLLAIEKTEPGLLANAGVLKNAPCEPKPPPTPAENNAEQGAGQTSLDARTDQPINTNHAANTGEALDHSAHERMQADAAAESGKATAPSRDAGDSVDQLNEQLTALLDEARGVEAAAPSQPTGAPGSSSSPADAATAAEANAGTIDDPDDAATQEVIHQIDELLASGAEEAVEDAFDTSATILGNEQVPPTGPRGEIPGADVPDAVSNAISAIAQPAADIPSHADAHEQEPTRADIARELDEQPEHIAAKNVEEIAAAPAADDTEAATSPFAQAAAATSTPPYPTPTTAAVVPVGGLRHLYRVCATINHPLRMVSTEVRRGVGYAALLLLFNGVVLTLFGIIRVIVG